MRHSLQLFPPARVAALADRQAATVLPPVEPSTYGSPKGSAARIYRAAG